jgi:hypothetical protein
MTETLTVGFWSGIDYSNPRFTAAAAAVPSPGFVVGTIGGPRLRDRVLAETAACERTLESLRAELAAMPAETVEAQRD